MHCVVVRTLSQLTLLNRMQIFRFLDVFNNCLAQNVTFSILEKFSDACHVNNCFRYHKRYPAMHEDYVKSLAILCYDYFEDLLASITFAKTFGFLAGVFANKHTFATNHNGN